MKQLITKYQILLFCIVNIALLLGIVLIYSLDDVPQQWAPGLIAIIIVSLIKGKRGLFELFSKMVFRRVYFKWYAFAFIIPLIICGASFLTISLIKYGYLVFPNLNHSLESYLFFLFFIVLGSIGEEIGWRGFMLPLLLRKHSYFISSIMIGIFWGVWHLQFQVGISTFFIYILLTIEMSIVMTWFYKKTNGNIVSAIIMHSLFNLCALVLFEDIVTDISHNSELIRLLYVSLVGLFFPLCIYIVIQMRKEADNRCIMGKIL